MIQQVAEMQPRRIPYAFRYEIPEEFTCLPDPTASDGWDEVMRELLRQRTTSSEMLPASSCVASCRSFQARLNSQ